MKKYIQMFLDPAPDSAGGDPLPPLPKSLADLDNPSPDDLAAAAEAQRLADEATPPAAPTPVEGVNEDGTLQEGYSKDAEGNVVKDEPVDAGTKGDDTEGDEGSFWDDVDALRGEPLVIDWDAHKDADGNPIDPVSAEGAYIREKAIERKTIDDYDDYLKKIDPRGYAYMLHRQAGGTDEEFLATKSANLPEYEAFKESVDAQSALYKQALVGRGLDADLAQLQVDKAVKDGKLFELADKEYKAHQAQNEAQLKAIEQKNAVAQQNYTNAVNKLNASLVSSIQESKGLKFIIPDTDKAAFTEFVKKGVRFDAETNSFSIVQELGEDNSRLLESMFLLYKKGDLTGLIKREAQSATVKRLQKTVLKAKSAGGAAVEPPGAKKDYIPLGNI
jgi:hypothetical protein